MSVAKDKQSRAKAASIVVLSFLISLSVFVSANYLELNKHDFAVGETVIIDVNKTLLGLNSANLIIDSQGRRYTYQGELLDRILFSANNLGSYTVRLVDTTNSSVYEQESFVVTHNNQPNNNGANEQLLFLNKRNFYDDELIQIIVNTNNTQNYNLVIETNGFRTSYQGVDTELLFRPTRVGNYTIYLYDAFGNLINTLTFSVVQRSQNNNYADNGQTNDRRSVTIRQSDILQLESSSNKQLKIMNSLSEFREENVVLLENTTESKLYYFNPSHNIELIEFKNIAYNQNESLGFEEVPLYKNKIYGKVNTRAFAIDPTRIDFQTATVTFTAQGEELYKCTDYNFTTQSCYGNQTKIMDLVIGQVYTFNFTRLDPLYTQVISSGCNCSGTDSAIKDNPGQATCNTYCPITVDVPPGAQDGYLFEIIFNATITITPDGGVTVNSADHRGHFDHDQTYLNSNELRVGLSTSTTSTTVSWTQSNLNDTGNTSFTWLDCGNWPDNCTWYTRVASIVDFSTSGRSVKYLTTQITLDNVEVTWNFTGQGATSVVLNWPENNDYTNNPNMFFNFTSLTASTLDYCGLYNDDGGWSEKNTNTSPQNNTPTYLNDTISADGTYSWNVWCNSTDSSSSWAPANYTFTLDRQDPNINLMTPNESDTWTSSSVVDFIFNASDNSGQPLTNCSLYINGSYADTATDVSQDTPTTFNYALSNGAYNWYVECYDIASNSNVSVTRNLTVQAPIILWGGLWYETGAINYNYTIANIALANQTDGTQNTVNNSLLSGTTVDLVNATSPYIGNNGAFIPSGSTVTFRSYFTLAEANLFTDWTFLTESDSGARTDYCFASDTSAVPGDDTYVEEICTFSSDVTIGSSEKLVLFSNISNTHASQTRDFTHAFDHADSWMNFSNFYMLGTLSANMTQPNDTVIVQQGETFNFTCNVTCTLGYCINTYIYAQYNTSVTAWQNITTSGNLVLAGGEVNPALIGNFTGGALATILMNGSTGSTNNIRCYASSRFENYLAPQLQQVIVTDAAAPDINLTAPPNTGWINTTNITFYFDAYDASGLNNCSLYINNTFNTSKNTSELNNGGSNNLTALGFSNGWYNWTVNCTDTGFYEGAANDGSWLVYVDTAPPNVTRYYPGPDENISFNWINFNWTVQDNMAVNSSCDLYVDGSINASGLTVPTGNPYNRTVAGFSEGLHNWSLNCWDEANNLNSTSTWWFNVSNTPPIVTLYNPSDPFWSNESTLFLYYNFSDNNGAQNCSLLINGSIYNTTFGDNVTNNDINNFSVTLGDNQYNWTVECYDGGGLYDSDTVRTLYIDTTQPNARLVNPANESQLASGDVSFTINATDNLAPIINCNITLDGQYLTNVNANNGANTNFAEPGISDGVHYWNATCVDFAGNTNTSLIPWFNVSQAPTVALNNPPPNAYRQENVTFTFTPTDNDGFSSCDLIIDGVINDTLPSANITNGGLTSWTINYIGAGSHTWQVNCTDNGTHSSIGSSGLRLFYVDMQKPNVQLNFPGPFNVVNFSYVNFNWTADDDQDLTPYCNLTINDIVNKTDIASPDGVPTNWTVGNFTNGEYNWSVTCIDDAGNFNISDTYWFNITVPPTVNLDSPPPEFWDYYLDQTLYYYVDANDPLQNCTLYIDDLYNDSNSTPANKDFNSFDIVFAQEEFYNWSVSCTDNGNVTGYSEVWNLNIDWTLPTVNLTNPSNDSMWYDNYVDLNWTFIDNMAPNGTCNLTIDDGGGAYVETPYNIITFNDTEQNITKLYHDGQFVWNVTCWDLAGVNGTSFTYNFTIYAPPNVSLDYPPNNHWNNTGNVSITYTPYDPFFIRNCSMYLNDNLDYNTSTINQGLPNYYTFENLASGYYNWTVGCYDVDNNYYQPPVQWFYVDVIEPTINLVTPVNGDNFTVDSVLFNFSVTDDFDDYLSCNLTVDNIVRAENVPIANNTYYNTTLNGFGDEVHYWNVTCVDNATNYNTSDTRSFTVNITPTVTLGAPDDDWYNDSSVTFFYNASDNDGFGNCSLIINDALNDTAYDENITGIDNFSVTGFNQGIFNWTVGCYDNGTYNNYYQPPIRWFYTDWTPPNINLTTPLNGNVTFNKSVLFNFTATDNLATNLTCYLTFDGSINQTMNLTNNSYWNKTLIVDTGLHYWNVTCTDIAGNTNTSNTYNFSVPNPNLYINNSMLWFNQTLSQEGQNVTLYANITNAGGSDAQNVLVRFYENAIVAPNQIGSDQYFNITSTQTINTSVNWTVKIGSNTIWVLVDPLNAIGEVNESDNNASIIVTIAGYHLVAGNISGELVIGDQDYNSVFAWNKLNSTGDNLYATDYDSSINWPSLQAIGVSTTQNFAVDDWQEIDEAILMSNFSDSINASYTQNFAPRDIKTFEVFNNPITNVSIVNSTINNNFVTGILWDYGDGGVQYNNTQDLVFVTEINVNTTGQYGNYDFEFKIPANLRLYLGPNTQTVAFYAEIK
ncbi:hypothetical protein GOV04_03320 [Candidatus Woesearchaeota archaeon]|nr:hypothetical protein [Candidatus Woesearchaeota archaeon]